MNNIFEGTKIRYWHQLDSVEKFILVVFGLKSEYIEYVRNICQKNKNKLLNK